MSDDNARPTRVGHWKHDACEVYVGRGSRWGNPFVPRGWGKRSKHAVTEHADPLGAYEAHVRATPALMAALPSLRGRVLGCWCVRLGSPHTPERCHGHSDETVSDAVERVAVHLAEMDERAEAREETER